THMGHEAWLVSSVGPGQLPRRRDEPPRYSVSSTVTHGEVPPFPNGGTAPIQLRCRVFLLAGGADPPDWGERGQSVAEVGRPDARPFPLIEPAAVRIRVGIDLSLAERPQQHLEAGPLPRRRPVARIDIGIERMRHIEQQHPLTTALDAPEER